MMAGFNDSRSSCARIGSALVQAALSLALFIGPAGCDALNPAFVNVASGGQAIQTIDNAPGYVVVAVVNNTTMDERLISYLGPQLDLSEAEIQSLVPRIRLLVDVTFVDGSTQEIEFITGTPNIVEPEFAAQAETDLNQNDLDNTVMLCDVVSVVVDQSAGIEVFIPVEMTRYELVETSGEGGQIVTEFVPRQAIPPAFETMDVDDIDESGNTILRRNIGIRDTPSPVGQVICGSVVTVLIEGTLTVPFLDEVSDAPSFDGGDIPTVAGIGGRYSFSVTVR